MGVKLFNYALDNVWYANEVQYKADYLKSIVFIHKSNGDGVAIYAHGSYFPTDVSLNNFNELVNSLLSEGNNITITPTIDAQGKITDLKIGAVSLSSLTNLTDNDKTKLVEAQAVASALTEPINTALTLTDNNKVATFTETYKNLNGDTINATSSVLKVGDNVTFANDNGLKISAEDTTYDISASASSDNKGVDFKLNTTGTSTSDTITFAGSGATAVSVSGTTDTEVITISSTDTTYTKVDGSAITVTQPAEGSTQGTIGLTIPTAEKMLGQTNDGFTTTLNIKYYSKAEGDKLANHIYLLGKNGVEIDKFDASAFVKDSFLKEAKFVTNPAGQTTGDYIQFTFQTINTDGEGNPEDITNVVYVQVSEFVKTGTLTYDNDKKQWVAGTESGKLVTVTDVADALNLLDADLDAIKGTSADANEIAVVTGITQEAGKITAVDSGLSVTKTYVDNKFGEIKHNIVSAPKTEDKENYATVTPKTNADGSINYEVVVSGIDNAIATATITGTIVNQGTSGTYNFVEINKGLMTADAIASLINEAWSWGTI